MDKKNEAIKKGNDVKTKAISFKNAFVKYCYENRIMEGSLNEQNVAIISYLLGLVGGICALLSFNKTYGNFFTFVTCLSIYHNMEFISTATFKREVCSIDCK